MAHEVHNRGLGESVWEALEVIDDGDQDVFDTPIAQIVHHRKPEFGPLIGRNPQAENLASPQR